MSKAAATSRARAKHETAPPVYVGRDAGTFDDATVERMCAKHATGVFWKHCLDAEGLSESGWHEAKAREPRYVLAQQRAKAAGVEALRRRRDQLIEDGFRGEWKAAAWDLERFDREAFAPPTSKVESKNEHTGRMGRRCSS